MNRFSKVKISRTVLRDETVNNLDIAENMKKHRTNEKDSLFVSSASIFDYSVCICFIINKDLSQQKIESIAAFRSFFKESHIFFSAYEIPSNSEIRSMNYTSVVDLTVRDEYIRRNAYLEFFKRNKEIFDFMLVMDTDFLETPINATSLDCLNNIDEWDAVFANQSYKYYDIENLITNETKEYHEEVNIPKKNYIKKLLQYHIPRDLDPIPVKSAFGGMAIYRSSAITNNTEYKPDGHKSFNILVNKRMFIYPSLVLKTPNELASLYM
jgi:hypothetical protein